MSNDTTPPEALPPPREPEPEPEVIDRPVEMSGDLLVAQLLAHGPPVAWSLRSKVLVPLTLRSASCPA